MAIIWLDIWDAQSGNNAKLLINRYFNIGKYITTIHGTNINLGILQYKNCWKWGYMTFSYRIQGTKCIKCNGPYKSENHREFGWCCKANEKTNPPCLEIKKSKPCPHSFKYSNFWRDHQADSNQCSFWRYCFNREWQQKKYIKICENRVKSICSIESGKNLLWSYETLGFFPKTFTRTVSLSVLYLKPNPNSMSSSSKNLLGQLFIKSPAY